METTITIMSDNIGGNGKENGNYYSGFRVQGLGFRVGIILGQWKRKWKLL